MQWKPISQRIKDVLAGLSIRDWIVIAVSILLFSAIFISFLIRPASDLRFADEMKSIHSMGVIKVGVLGDVHKFSSVNKQGELEGIEIDLAKMLSQKIFENENSVEFIFIDPAAKTSVITTRAVDCVIALCEIDYTSKLIYSSSYYTDAVVALVRASDERISDVDQLGGKKVGVLNKPARPARYGALDVVMAYSEKLHFPMEIIKFSGMYDMTDALRQGTVSAVFIESAQAQNIFNESFRVLPVGIGTVDYAISIHPDNFALKSIATDMLKEMKKDGSLYQLWAKWELNDYRTKK